jgi:uncharacterized protein (DUF1499 family)
VFVATDFRTLKLTWKPNQFLVLPPNYKAQVPPHRVSPAFPMAPDQLLEAVKRVALAEPRTVLAEEDAAAHKLEFVQRSKTFRFPDFVSVEAVPLGAGRTALAIYSRAKLGIRDFGVNRARVERWLTALQAKAGSGSASGPAGG